jgi:hypothetical protein
MNHIVIRDIALNGWEYGMLRSFETAIAEETDAKIVDLPGYGFGSKYIHHFGYGMKRSSYRKFLPKQDFGISADVAWCILMGPENYKLDLYKNWANGCKIKILYLFDTLPHQYPLIKELLNLNTWDILITSFNDAVIDLEKITGRKWYCVEQAADKHLFQPVPQNDRVIHFSAYGRRYPALHEALKEFCIHNGLYYDYTTHDAKHPVVDSTELYRQYAWHLTHSVFTFSWPVEMTNPGRAGHLHPITCRWFEAAAAGTVILGRQPNNEAFAEWIGTDTVVDIDPDMDKPQLFKKLELIWNNRETETDKISDFFKRKSYELTWNERVRRINTILCNHKN